MIQILNVLGLHSVFKFSIWHDKKNFFILMKPAWFYTSFGLFLKETLPFSATLSQIPINFFFKSLLSVVCECAF